MGTKNLGLTQYPNATGNTILANWNSDAEKIDANANNSNINGYYIPYTNVTRGETTTFTIPYDCVISCCGGYCSSGTLYATLVQDGKNIQIYSTLYNTTEVNGNNIVIAKGGATLQITMNTAANYYFSFILEKISTTMLKHNEAN